MEPSLSPPVVAIVAIALALPAVAGMWVLVTGILASISGWTELAATFATNSRPSGKPLRRYAVVKLGSVSEKNVTTLRPAREGLYLTSNPLFRFRRPPVLVPWNRIRYVASHKVLWQRSCTLDLGGVTTIRVRDWVIPALREHGLQVPRDADR